MYGFQYFSQRGIILASMHCLFVSLDDNLTNPSNIIGLDTPEGQHPCYSHLEHRLFCTKKLDISHTTAGWVLDCF